MKDDNRLLNRIEVFIAYARKDSFLRGELEKHLSLLKSQRLIDVWHDQDITAGMEWSHEINKHLNTSSIFLLLISPDFMASDYCYSVEMQRALERHNAGDACVIPIILRPVDVQGAPFSKLQALPMDAKPITQWSNRDAALFSVVKGIRKTIATLMIQLQPRRIALFGYETQNGSKSVLWNSPDTFSLDNETSQKWQKWFETKRAFTTEREFVDHIWVKVGDHGYSFALQFMSDGQLLCERPLLDPTRQVRGSWKLIDGVLRTTIEQDEDGMQVRYELDIFADRNSMMHSGIEFRNGSETAHAYFVFFPSSQATNHLEEALTAYDHLLQVNQNCVEAYKTKGNLLRNLERYEEALDAYQRAIEMKPDYMCAWYDMGDILRKMKRLDEAIAAFDHAIALEGKNAWAWYKKGQTLYDLERYDEVLTANEQASLLDPNNVLFWHHKGEVLRKLQRYQEALAAYEQALRVDPKFAKSYNGMGNVLYHNLKHDEEAIVAYQRATEIAPDYMWAWHNMGNVLHKHRRFQEAFNAYKRTTEIDPSYFWAWYNMGDVLHELGHLEEALNAFDEAIRRNDRVAVTWREKGKTFQDLERYEEALVAYEQALELESQYALIWTKKGQVLRMLKRYEEALIAYDKALQLEAKNVEAYLGKGRVYLDLGSYNEALEVYEQAVSVAPSNTWAWHDKGQTLGHLQRAEEALEAFEQAIKLDSENKWAWLHKAETLMYLAQQAYKKAGQPGREPLRREYSSLIHKVTGKCLDAYGHKVYLCAANGGDFQLWRATEVSPNVIVLRHFQSGKVLDVTLERDVCLSEYNNNPSQQWKVEDASNGDKKLKHIATGMLLDGGDNDQVYLYDENGGDFQFWRAGKIHLTSLITSYDSLHSDRILSFEQ